MTSKSLYFKLQREDLKRRVWAIALSILGFFFALPINLALSMENAINTDFYRVNGYKPLVFAPGATDVERVAKILELKTKVVIEAVEFGNGMTAFLLILAAVVMGVSSFSYLHNRKKVDFYHSIPVKREMLFAVQYTGGVLIVAAAYLLNLLFLLGVSMAYGVNMPVVLPAAMAAWVLNLLYFLLMYAVAVIAMMMTGNVLIGILANGVFNFFAPAMSILIMSYCETFFETMSSHFWDEGGRLIRGFGQWSSPFSAYMMGLSWGGRMTDGRSEIYKHIPALVITFFVAVGLNLLAMELYRKRPSESAGKAMTFKWSMAPIRILMVLGFGLAGGMFFWAMQSTLFWAVFGAVIGCVISHCVIEIIYHFDFKKLFSNKLQLALCLAGSVLMILAFRFDWFRYDSYLPDQSRVADVAMDIGLDNEWVSRKQIIYEVDNTPAMKWVDSYEVLPETMHLEDMEPALDIARMGRDEALKNREKKYQKQVTRTAMMASNSSQWIAKSEESDAEADNRNYFTDITVIYTLNSGRKVSRRYYAPLSEVMDSYNRLYSQREYKESLYDVLNLEPVSVVKSQYLGMGYMKEIPDVWLDGYTGLLTAYQADLRELTLQTRQKENAIGQICFYTAEEQKIMELSMERFRLGQDADYSYQYSYAGGNVSQSWPVYPSFKRTIEALKEAGEDPQKLPENIQSLQVDFPTSRVMTDEEKKEGEPSLERLLTLNPRFRAGGQLVFEDPEEIRLLMNAFVLDENTGFSGLCPVNRSASVVVNLGGNYRVYGGFQLNRMTPEVMKLFEGTPMKEMLGESGNSDTEYAQEAGVVSDYYY